VPYGITTVVGCLGVDTTMKTLAGLLARVKGLKEEGLSAYMWTGGYNVPPSTILDSPREDVMFVEEIVGCGEVAISDERATDPEPRELARLVSDVHAGGMLSRKAGVTHFHVGEGPRRMQCLRDILDERLCQTRPEWLYATHITRSEALLDDAIALAKRGAYVDMDTTEEGLGRWLRYYLEHGGDPTRLTISSDAHTPSGSPDKLYQQFVASVRDNGLALEQVLPCLTQNTARALKLPQKGRIAPAMNADLVVMKEQTLDLVHVFARGRQLLRDGRVLSAD